MVRKFDLKSQPSKERVTVAQSTLSTAGVGRCCVLCRRDVYSDVPLLAKILCCDLLLGQDFMRQHEAVKFLLQGAGTALEVEGHPKHCAVAKAEINTPSLFTDLAANYKPTAARSRQFNKEHLR